MIPQLTYSLAETTFLLVGCRPYKKFVDGKPTDVTEGNTYTLVCPNHGYEKLTVKVAEATPAIPPESIDSKAPIKVKVIDLGIRIYKDHSGEYNISAKATRIEVAK